MEEICIFVPGEPAPGGSKKGFYNAKLNRVLMAPASKRTKPWMACVSAAAQEVVKEVLTGPVRVRFDFIVVRPKGHFGAGKNSGVLKSSAPAYPTTRPDCTKNIRSTEDALKGIAWRDDSQVVTLIGTKRYGNQAGAWIRIREEVPA